MTALHAYTMTSPLGLLHLRLDAQARLVALEFEDRAARMDAWLATRYAQPTLLRSSQRCETVERLNAYFDGDLDAIEAIAIEPRGTPFQQRCWAELRRIPAGRPCSYSDEARAIGSPLAVRAVGRANGTNPIPIVVPCHRVIARDGSLGGYSCGLSRKAWLLEHEARHAKRVVVDGLFTPSEAALPA